MQMSIQASLRTFCSIRLKHGFMCLFISRSCMPYHVKVCSHFLQKNFHFSLP
ncbi:hypothetical protein NC653_016973 [Populus alba x Populus x berolinensis]|uniref:Uncharacterized protein n=1 Tax=Populus alba x Populus x berolinensis TaxID=444605 RepID=A0AAD6QPI2_9ROSI|nr:hypothetical protein NC653_016973 [Populus alba x Populus x berolinensis]